MIEIAKKFFKGTPKRRVVEVGWLIDTDKSSLIWDPPKPYLRPPFCRALPG
jgi:hypothetical protein